jgi:peptidylprolyl isomerase
VASKPGWLDLPSIPAPEDVAQPPTSGVETNGFLISRVLAPGRGTVRPGPHDIVRVAYTGWTAEGATIDSSSFRGAPTTWTMDEVMPGLRAGLELMVAGEKRRLWLVPQLSPTWAPGPLVFDVELLDIRPGRERPPDDQFEAPPPGTPSTPAGVSYQVLRAGKGSEHPKALSTVTLHYTGWTASKELFDDTVVREEPLTVAVETLMPGLAEGVQRMAVGEKCRLWIPARLAYTPPGPPLSALVMDVELVAVQKAVAGSPGTIEVRTNSPNATYVLVQPDGTGISHTGDQVVKSASPGRYRIKAEARRSYALGIVASSAGMLLEPGGTLVITITYRAIVR